MRKVIFKNWMDEELDFEDAVKASIIGYDITAYVQDSVDECDSEDISELEEELVKLRASNVYLKNEVSNLTKDNKRLTSENRKLEQSLFDRDTLLRKDSENSRADKILIRELQHELLMAKKKIEHLDSNN